MIVVASDVSGVTVKCLARRVREGVPNTYSSTSLLDAAFNLVSRRCDAKYEISSQCRDVGLSLGVFKHGSN
jgi:hypothetical protein